MPLKSPARTKDPNATRTTLTLGNDALILIRQRAGVTGQTLGEAATDLIREAAGASDDAERRTVNGILLLPNRGNRRLVTMEEVNELRDEWP